MNSSLIKLSEPTLLFGYEQAMQDPRDGLTPSTIKTGSAAQFAGATPNKVFCLQVRNSPSRQTEIVAG
jgi:hypothetical protein